MTDAADLGYDDDGDTLHRRARAVARDEITRAIDRLWRSIATAIVGASLGLMGTIGGAAWYLGGRLAEQETALRALGDRVASVEDRIDRMEERQWAATHTDGGTRGP